jgi:polyribonucleotide nucleotidyltransferase
MKAVNQQTGEEIPGVTDDGGEGRRERREGGGGDRPRGDRDRGGRGRGGRDRGPRRDGDGGGEKAKEDAE